VNLQALSGGGEQLFGIPPPVLSVGQRDQIKRSGTVILS
jgi:hypothetical protein